MGFDPFSRINKRKDDAEEVLGAAWSVLPIVGAVGYAYDKRKLGNLNPKINLGMVNELKPFGTNIGKELVPGDLKEKMVKSVMEGEAYKRIVSNGQERRAAIQAILTSLDADDLGIDRGQVADLKERLLSVAELDDKDVNDELLKPLKDTIDTINSGNPRLRAKVADAYSELRTYKSKIVSSKTRGTGFGSKLKVNSIALDDAAFLDERSFLDSLTKAGVNLNNEGARDYAQLLYRNKITRIKGMSSGVTSNLQLDVVDVGAGQKGLSMRFMSGQAGSRRARLAIPLGFDLERIARGDSRPVLTRLGPGYNTPYMGPRSVADARAVSRAFTDSKLTPHAPDLAGKGFLRDMGDFALDLVQEEVSFNANGTFSANKGRWKSASGRVMNILRANMEVVSRSVNSRGATEYHANRARNTIARAGAKHNTVLFTNLENLTQAQRDDMLKNLLGPNSVLDPGVGNSRLESGMIEGRKFGLLQFSKGSLLGRLKYRVDSKRSVSRQEAPLLSRLEQIEGRTSRFVATVGKKNQTAKVAGIGLGADYDSNPFIKGFAGDKRVLVALDMTMGEGQGVFARHEGRGQYGTAGDKGLGKFEVERTIPLFDPDTNGFQSSELLEKLKQQNGPVWYSREQLAGKNGYLGTSSQGPRRVKLMARETGAFLQLKEITEAGNKTQLHVEVLAQRETDKMKVFGFSVKGTAVAQPVAVAARDLATYNVAGENRNVMRDLLSQAVQDSANPTKLKESQHVLQNFIFGSGDMLKKSRLARRQAAITSAAAALKIGHGDLLSEVQKVAKNKGDVGVHLYRKIALGVAKGEIDADFAGRALSMTRWGGGFKNSSGKQVGGWAKEFSAASELMSNAENDLEILNQIDAVKKGKAADALVRMRAVAETGLGFTVDTVVPGTGHGDYGIGVGSVEPRTVQYLKSMLGDSGLSNDEQVKFMRDILSRKVGGAAGRRAILPLQQAAFSTISLPMGDMEGVKRYTLDQIFEEVGTADELRAFMRNHDKGFFIDFKGNENMREAVLNQAGEETFGNDRQIYILGKDALENMKGTEIKQTNNTIKVGSYYEEKTGDFLADMQKLSSKEGSSKDQYAEAMKTYKKNIMGLFTNSLHQLTRGKIKGNTMNVLQFIGAEYNGNVAGLTSRQGDYFKATQVVSGRNSLYLDHFAFLNNLKEFMGTASGKSEGGQALRDFFLNAEQIARDVAAGKTPTVKGALMLVSRAPMLGKGNLRFAEMHRDPSEMFKGKHDVVFQELLDKNNKSSRAALLDLGLKVGMASKVTKKMKDGSEKEVVQWNEVVDSQGKKTKTTINSFGDILDLETTHRDQVREFFEQLAQNVQKWHTSEGGGSMYMVEDKVKIKSTTGSFQSKADVGMAASAIADADGDWGSSMRFSGSIQASISKLLDDPNYRKAVLAEALHTEVYSKFAKEGLNAGSSTLIDTEEEAIGKDAMKEKTTSAGTGPVDVALNKLRNATIAMEGSDKQLAGEVLTLLKGLEEHTTIKGKKLKDFKPWAERMATSVDEAFKRGNIESVANFFRTEIFPESSEALKELYEGFELEVDDPRYSSQKVKVYGLNAALEFLEKAVINAKANKIDLMATPNIAAHNLMRDEHGVARELAYAIQNGTPTVQSAMAQEMGPQDRTVRNLAAANDGRARLQGMFDTVNTRTAGMVVGGLALGAMVMSGMRPNASSAPLMVDGEMPSAALQNAPGDALTASEARAAAVNGPSPYDLLNRPHGPGVTQMVEESGLSIRGAVEGLAGMTQAGSYINMMTRGNARGSVLINDTRRPITPNYLDRINGEY